ncbi:hypothetical protein N0V93_005027 [Gnomoniopsis smithogilvyi]|uniref:Uncharacterized protein n=1 Tax=Gnomoniopsis smithogilvyi TaxID=1191159 RepID=A0A9W8YTS7_9PEZI|nr:hypothetical protein N0V93_005027 [Gnomoniopsis smithogilvyi]
MSDDALHIHRPIPRRPFDLGLASLTLPNDDQDSPPSSPRPSSLEDEQTGQNYDDPNAFNPPIDSSSRAESYRFLTSSTLSGIYSPNISGYDEGDASAVGTPMPGKFDASVYKLVKDRSSMLSRRRSSTVSGKSGQGFQPATTTALVLRTGLLFLLGMGYGALLLRLSTEQKWASFPVEGIIKPGHDGRYLAAWGLCGVVLGSLLPWFDGKWEETFERGQDHQHEDDIEDDEDGPGTDWALVVRGIGAFAGIVFAIRKVPWASTMQVSLTLAMANPLLWYLIDRSKTGFLLSAAVGLAGTIVSLGLNPEIMPTPIGYSSSYQDRNATGYNGNEVLMLGGLATKKTIETGIWVISVLFCSCGTQNGLNVAH